ncbi:FlgO family outer membrane protein [Fundidesulfovibrio agrisoli]|uniref:FlgO family outer membrane protein n=1 Tax=Fundidesulfovibrio agrisoli TaxID=2922717 RepID=UPI001FAE52D2|nr:FlgO family outer membrane protein [Fundidesulfovibrio agrisoli]
MRAKAFLAALATLALGAVTAAAQTAGPVDPGAEVDLSKPQGTTINGVSGVRVRSTPGASQGYLVPDASGGYVNYAPGPPLPPPSPSRADAEELRLYARELAAQITTGITGEAPLAGVSSVPSAFVDQDSRLTSSFGRLLGEQMIYEINSRGFPVKEARGNAPAAAKGRKAPSEHLAVLAGSYYVDRDNIFVNARLVEPSGRVLRTGSVLIPMTPTLRRMLGLPEPGAMQPRLPTLIGARDVNDPPGAYGKPAAPYSPSPTKAKAKSGTSASSKKASSKKAKQPCPPGCEPIDTNAKAPAQPAQQAQPGQAPGQTQGQPQGK